ncbi:hypothetical protein L873DRAFT_1933284 [Choiromyces venosus 120613-1]|uniref:Uncharacterized protein n=1 Tax=Choiromyces venosus 120613-1 TaxID=1336337 RepID=A0A3N4K1D5_9PEZI|nr:hypothetical protein L873DRAFT_1933284 [Choiromyces venosus 120613-1]
MGHPPIFDEAVKKQLEEFIMRNAVTHYLSWEAIQIEMGYACSAKTLMNFIASMGYHKIVPHRKFNICPDNKPI